MRTHRLRLQTVSQKVNRPVAVTNLRFFQFLVPCFGSISSFATPFHELDQPGTAVQEVSRAPKYTFPVYTENELKHAIDKPF